MPEREYFSWRYAIPGYTLILLVTLINLIPLYSILKILAVHKIESTFGVFLGFLTLLSGSAVGFLTSQIWWSWFQARGLHYDRTPVQLAIDRYGLTRSEKHEDKLKVITVYDFLKRYKTNRMEKLCVYTTRRWDM